jgi:hypothetical protein
MQPPPAPSNPLPAIPRVDERALLTAAGEGDAEIVARSPVAAGLSAGAALERLTLRHRMPSGAAWHVSRVVKHLAPSEGWLGAASHDTRIREAQLHRGGILADLPHGIETAVLALATEGDPAAPTAAALLMRDMRARLPRDPLRTPPGCLPPLVRAILDRLAEMHARFWCDPRLRDPALGLVSTADALLLTAPERIQARIASGDHNPYLPLAAAGWDAFFRLADPAVAAALRAVFRDPAPAVAAIEALPWTLVHGDVWGPNLGWLPPARRTAPRSGSRLLLLDWALATAGPCTYDPLWLCGTWHALDPRRVLAAYRARLERRLRAHGIALPPATWRALAAAGYLRTALTCGEALGRAATEAPPGIGLRRAEERVLWWARPDARSTVASY